MYGTQAALKDHLLCGVNDVAAGEYEAFQCERGVV